VQSLKQFGDILVVVFSGLWFTSSEGMPGTGFLKTFPVCPGFPVRERASFNALS